MYCRLEVDVSVSVDPKVINYLHELILLPSIQTHIITKVYLCSCHDLLSISITPLYWYLAHFTRHLLVFNFSFARNNLNLKFLCH